ncbi:MAG: VanZ family protein [Syntrophomonadaceae bacterium]|jgi:VanZ family protein|nr:VanZ family protein [Syntrophomonadaceae bacterium]
MKKTSTKIAAWIPVILWMMLIFFLSAQSAAESSGLSSKVTELMLGLINKVVPAFSSGLVDYAYLNHVVRKLAHFLLYLVLGLLSARALRKNGITGGKQLVLAVIFCALYAVTDELHQMFVPGRSGQISDVVLDTMGGLAGVILYHSRQADKRNPS